MDVLKGNKENPGFVLVTKDHNPEGFASAFKTTEIPYTTINVSEFKELDKRIKKIIHVSNIVTGNLIKKDRRGLQREPTEWKFPFLIYGSTVIAHGHIDRHNARLFIEAFK